MERIRKLPEITKRKADAHKGDFGHVLVIAGSPGMTGAAFLASKSALRAGAGLVTLCIPESLNPIMEEKLTCVMTHPVPETEEKTISTTALEILESLAQDSDFIIVGPGLSRNKETENVVHALLKKIDKPIVIDADGVNAISTDVSVLKNSDFKRILTPHPGEMARLVKMSTKDVQKDRLKISGDFAKEHSIILVLKGYGSIVTDGEKYFINPTGNPGMASGGSGDVLTGLIGGLLGQGLNPFDAAQAGVYIHGLAGDFAAEEMGEIVMIASDLIYRLPEAFSLYKKKSKK